MPLSPSDVRITEQDVEFFQERGYWFGPRVLSDAEIAEARAEIERVLRMEWDSPVMPPDAFPVELDPKRNEPGSTSLRKMNNTAWISHKLRALCTSPVFGYMAAKISRARGIRLFKDQVIWKPPTEGKAPNRRNNIGWHQDGAACQFMDNLNGLSAWIALQDTEVSNGGMRYVRGSHKWGVIQGGGTETFYEAELDTIRERFSEGREWIEDPCIIKAGHVAFHQFLLVHGSGPNLSGEERLSITLHMIPSGTRVKGGQLHPSLVCLGPMAPAGTPLEGPCFPELWAEPA